MDSPGRNHKDVVRLRDRFAGGKESFKEGAVEAFDAAVLLRRMGRIRRWRVVAPRTPRIKVLAR